MNEHIIKELLTFEKQCIL